MRHIARNAMILVLIASVAGANAKVIRVPQDRPDIYNATYVAHAGDEIIVSPGIYKGPIPISDSLYIHSSDPTNRAVVDATIIEGYTTSSLPAVILSSDSGISCRLAGFTVRYAGGSGIAGGSSASIIEFCHILENDGGKAMSSMSTSDPQFGKPIHTPLRATDDRTYGGGIYSFNGTIQNCIIECNSAEMGAGLAECHGVIQNNIIARNRLVDYGGRGAAGAALYHCDGIIRGNTMADNSILSPAPGNTLTWRGGGIASCGGTIVNNIIWVSRSDLIPECSLNGSVTPSYCCIKGWTGGGVGNITADPKLLNSTFDEQSGSTQQGHIWPDQDWHLKTDSPCIDAGKAESGAPPADISGVQRKLRAAPGQNRGDGSGTDMGAYEALPKPVAVWLPDGGPPDIRHGQTLSVNWRNDPEAGSSARLRLYRGGKYYCDLGIFKADAGTSGTASVTLPVPLITDDTYTIKSISLVSNSYASNTAVFKITGFAANAVPAPAWLKYY